MSLRGFCQLAAALALLGACSSGNGGTDAGTDGGQDAGPMLTDGGGLGASCSSLYACAGNPFPQCGCAANVICANGQCASAGGPAVAQAVTVQFGGSAVGPLPDYLQVYLLAPQLVDAGSLDCSGIYAGLDGGTVDLQDPTQVNLLFPTYDQNVGIMAPATLLSFTLPPAASNLNQVLYLEGYEYIGQSDGGGLLKGRACNVFDAGLGTLATSMNALW